MLSRYSGQGDCQHSYTLPCITFHNFIQIIIQVHLVLMDKTWYPSGHNTH